MTSEEREQLASLLERFVEENRPVLEQLEKLGTAGAPIAKLEKRRQGAALILIDHLRGGEHQEVTDPTPAAPEEDGS